MKHATVLGIRLLAIFAVFGLTLLSYRSASAETHIIIFGGEVGFTYAPSQLQVAVGDVITWQGDFTMHPLQFDQVPDGAIKPENVTSGDAFSYTVQVAGDYRFHCMFHGTSTGSGMAGSFSVQSAGVDREIDMKMLTIAPNPVHQDSPLTVMLGFDPATIEQVNLCTVDGLCGSFLPGHGYHIESNKLVIPNTSWGAGAFVLVVVADGNIYRRKVIITR